MLDSKIRKLKINSFFEQNKIESHHSLTNANNSRNFLSKYIICFANFSETKYKELYKIILRTQLGIKYILMVKNEIHILTI